MAYIYIANASELYMYEDLGYKKISSYRKNKADKIHVGAARLVSITAGLLLNYATREFFYKKDYKQSLNKKNIKENNNENIKSTEDNKDNKRYNNTDIIEVTVDDLLDMYDSLYDFPIEEIGQGKPVYKDREDIYFNISHSGNVVVVVVSNVAVGVDIDGNRNFRDNMIDRFYSSNEATWVKENELYKNDRFFRIWTMKEAFSKLTGDGLIRTISNVEFIVEKKLQSDSVHCIYNGKDLDVTIKEYKYNGYNLTVIY